MNNSSRKGWFVGRFEPGDVVHGFRGFEMCTPQTVTQAKVLGKHQIVTLETFSFRILLEEYVFAEVSREWRGV